MVTVKLKEGGQELEEEKASLKATLEHMSHI